jgi:hypothetical protein
MNYRFNHKAKITELLEESIEKYLHNLRSGQDFLDETNTKSTNHKTIGKFLF